MKMPIYGHFWSSRPSWADVPILLLNRPIATTKSRWNRRWFTRAKLKLQLRARQTLHWIACVNGPWFIRFVMLTRATYTCSVRRLTCFRHLVSWKLAPTTTSEKIASSFALAVVCFVLQLIRCLKQNNKQFTRFTHLWYDLRRTLVAMVTLTSTEVRNLRVLP